MPKQRPLRLIEASGYQPTAEDVRALADEVWQLSEKLARARSQGAADMRALAVAKYEEFCQRDTFTDAEVVKALKSLRIPTD